MKPDLFSELLAANAAAAEDLTTLARALPAAPPSAGARERLLAAAREPAQRWAPFFDRLSRLFELGEAALVAIAERAAKPGEWEDGPLPGVRLFHLEPGPALALAGADAGLVKIEAGVHFPPHRHLGEERTLILEGRAREADGSVRGAGDHWFQSADSSHAFTVLEGAPLIYALVLFEGIELDGQPLRVRAR